MNSNIYEASRDVFLDTVDTKDYIQLDRVSAMHNSLMESVSKPLKMVLLYGRPGTGKSMFLTKLHDTLSKTQEVVLYKTPILDESEFYKTLAQDLYSMRYEGELNFTQFIKVVENRQINESTPIIMLDEAQLYSTTVMEKIRLLSDTRKMKFVIALHKTEKEDVIAKEHFQTRIWESFKLENASMDEQKMFIQKKLMKANCVDTAAMFSQSSMKLIHMLTNGNYRDTNKLLFTIFDIYSHYAQNAPNKINKKEISKKMIEMAALYTGLLND